VQTHFMSTQEQPDDSQPDDSQADDQPDAAEPEAVEPEVATDGEADEGDEGGGDEESSAPSGDERIEKLTEHIDEVRAAAEEAGVIDNPEEEEFVDSGATEQEDDQTIAPPG
jgi:hypothetical protein